MLFMPKFSITVLFSNELLYHFPMHVQSMDLRVEVVHYISAFQLLRSIEKNCFENLKVLSNEELTLMTFLGFMVVAAQLLYIYCGFQDGCP